MCKISNVELHSLTKVNIKLAKLLSKLPVFEERFQDDSNPRFLLH